MTFSSIGAPHGHTTFTPAGAKFRCACGRLLADRAQLAAHLALVAMITAVPA